LTPLSDWNSVTERDTEEYNNDMSYVRSKWLCNYFYLTHTHTHTHTRARARARARVCVCVCVILAKGKCEKNIEIL